MNKYTGFHIPIGIDMTVVSAACDTAAHIFTIVLEVKGDQVKIGITAPKEVPIYRKEVYLQIQEANKAAVDAEGMAALKNLLG